METYIKGNYRKSIFESDKGYVIGIFKVKETNIDNLKDFVNKTITFTGYFHELNLDDMYIFYGEETTHPRYGHQFNVVEYERVKPEGKDGIIEFLSSDLFPGIGEKMAEAIVDTLGDNALEDIIHDVSCLYMVPKLSKKKADKIYDILRNYDESHSTIVYLNELGFSMKDSLLIYNKYKGKTLDKIDENIYQLIDDIEEISFLKIDEIAKKIGLEPDNEKRIKACIIYTMNNMVYKNGDTYLSKQDIYISVLNYLNISIDEEMFDNYFYDLETENKIIIEDEHYYLKEVSDAENNVAEAIINLTTKEIRKHPKAEIILDNLQEGNSIIYNDKQKEAILKAMENNILIITGGPGTGKTTIIKAICDMYENLNKISYDKLSREVALLAPTGRASKRMSEATYLPAMTIHRFLKWNKETNEFGVNEHNISEAKMVIVDEVSMIDIMLLDNLLKGLSSDIKLILVGDYNQLPSVGPGQVLKDLIDSNIIDTIHLDLLYRQDENSYINTLAQEIKDNDLSEYFMEPKEDFMFLECPNQMIKNSIKTICSQIVNKGYDYKRVQVMAPMYNGENGIDNLNKELQEIFNPPHPDKKELRTGDIIYRENDKILQLVNLPEENIFNGDIGTIKYIVPAHRSKSGKNELHIDFDGNLVSYTPKDFVKIKHGFIISIHKAQGSEFEVVVMPISPSYRRMLYRKLVYTGVTRAKKRLIMLGDPMSFVSSIRNTNEYSRKTSLLNKIQNKLYNK